MVFTKTERQLKNLGLNSYEAKIWIALLAKGLATTGELSGVANVPRSRSYDVLESLEKKGFVIMKLGKPIKYTAVTPREAIEKLKKSLEESTKEEIKKLSDLKNTNIAEELHTLHNRGVELVESADLSGSLRGRHNLYNHIKNILKKAKENILISTTPTELVFLVEEFKLLFEKLNKKNVSITILTQINNQTKKYLNDIKNCAKIKNTSNMSRFCIVDGKEIVFMVLDDNEVHPTYDVGIWANTAFAKDLERIYLSF